ncbi:HEAT repeat domain-containing protein [Halorarum halobium]|uniref:HEAT repeat domain-containing protein n=1 Tax=Halorarum halobium TaxID=3075121 RepID=UPI0028AFDEED|nr:HEAT repeat domain-containing protein [Halobaculum sp. XH14]
MDDPSRSRSPDHLVTLLADGRREAAAASLRQFETAATEDRKRALRALRDLAADRAAAFDGVVSGLSPFLSDDDRAVRLAAAKLLVTVAESEPGAVVSTVGPVADRLADEDEFYYVRARSAEVLGYVALEFPEAVCSPEILADLRVGLSFDEPEVREKLAKALEHVALGDPGRLRHQVSTLADHLDDGEELVRYHLATALVAVGSAYPERLTGATEALAGRLDDGTAHVRGRAAEALGLLGRDVTDGPPLPESALAALSDDEEEFVGDRARFALDSVRNGTASDDPPDGIGSIDGVRRTTGEAVDAIVAPTTEGECPHCGLALPETGPPMCPRCGAPR